MILAGLNKRAARRLDFHPPKDFYFAFGLAVLAALLHTYALLVEFSRAAEFRGLTSRTVAYWLLVIELGLLLNVVGLWLRKGASILLR